MNGVKREFSKGEVIVHAGMEATRMFALVSGRIHVYKGDPEERPVLVREIEQGGVLGLWIHSVADFSCWPGTAVASEPCTVISLSMSAARRLARESDAGIARLAVNSMKILSCEMFRMWRRLTVMDESTIEGRIKTYLTILDNETGRTGSVTVPLDRERMAAYFGVTRPSLSRAIGFMRDRGLLTWNRNRFTINF